MSEPRDSVYGRVNISGLNKVELLRDLWGRQIVPPVFRREEHLRDIWGVHIPPFLKVKSIPLPPFDHSLAEEAVKKRIDYFCGVAIKCDLSGDEVDPFLYDRDAGKGKFQEVVDFMRSKK
jgi:hypothetical protein